MAKVFVDLSPLRTSRNFRLVFIGQLASTLGDQVTVVAVAYEVYRLTHSSLQVGLVSLAQLIPLLGVSLIGGSYVDTLDRRRLLVWSLFSSAVLGIILAGDAILPHPYLWPFYVFTALSAGLSGLIKPAQSAALPQMVTPPQITAALAIRQIMFQLGVVIGPSLAGITIAVFGPGAALGLDAFSFLVGMLTSMRLSPLPPVELGPKGGIRSAMAGLSYVRGSQVLKGIFIIDLSAMVFGLPRALFPALALSHFHGGAATLGYLYSAVGLGALVAAVTSGWVGRVRRQGLGVICAVVTWGAVIAAFGLAGGLILGLTLLAIAGYADLVSAVLRNSILQMVSPEDMRGRLSAIQIAVVTGGPRLGDLEAGLVATLFTTTISVISGGALCVLGAVVVWRTLPRFSQFIRRS